jgi:hypothetical protein
MLPKAWRPVACEDLIRLGSPFDGGYIVSARSIDVAEMVVSMGLNDDWTFEADVFERTGARIICYDHTVNSGFWRRYVLKRLMRLRPEGLRKYLGYRDFFGNARVEHRERMIGYASLGGTSLDEILEQNSERAIFLKVDIEGWEYRILDEIVQNQHRFTGIAMELHDVDLHRERIDRFFSGLTDMSIIHLHANNYGGTDPAGDPLVLEVCMVRKDLEPAAGASPAAAPVAQPNCASIPDIELHFAN